MSTNFSSDAAAVDALAQRYREIQSEIGKIIIGQDEVVKSVLISVFSNGHCLLVGVPGLAKTLLVQTIGQVLDLSFSRIQFTPDLMPSDITGSEVLDDQRNFRFIKGPLFSNIVLADEINRTPPKNPVGPARSHAGTSGNCCRSTVPFASPVFCPRHPKPH